MPKRYSRTGPAIQDRLAVMGLVPAAGTPEELAALIRSLKIQIE